MKNILFAFCIIFSSLLSQDNAKTPGMDIGEDKDLKVGEVAPSWALMLSLIHI